MIPTGVIKEFRGEHFFLSNYYEGIMEWRGTSFHSAEQAFAYAKAYCAKSTKFTDEYQVKVLRAESPGEAKQAGRQMLIDTDMWDNIRVQYMREIVHAKFATTRGLVGPLLNTGAKLLVEGNTWGDKFWGRCLDKSTGKMVGLNTLGTILMEERGYWLHSDFKEKK